MDIPATWAQDNYVILPTIRGHTRNRPEKAIKQVDRVS